MSRRRSIARGTIAWLTVLLCVFLAYRAAVPLIQTEAEIVADRWRLRREAWAEAARDRASVVVNSLLAGVSACTWSLAVRIGWPMLRRAMAMWRMWRRKPRWRRAWLRIRRKPLKPRITRSQALEL